MGGFNGEFHPIRSESVESATFTTSNTKSNVFFSSPQSKPNRANESNQENPHTPENERLEPRKHPSEKENHLPKPPFLGPMFIFQGV